MMTTTDRRCALGDRVMAGDYRGALACLKAECAACTSPALLVHLNQARHDTMASWWRASRRSETREADPVEA